MVNCFTSTGDIVIELEAVAKLQQSVNRKMKEEGWELPP